MMRRSTAFTAFIGLLSLLFMVSLFHAGLGSAPAQRGLQRMQDQVRAYELTDLSLFTEARYTRHLSQADWFTPFQDHPTALEHFPSGSLVTPPALLRAPR